MGAVFKAMCRDCGAETEVQGGGGFTFHDLTCDRCGRSRRIPFEKLGELHLRYVKGLPAPYSRFSAEEDEAIQHHYPGEPISEEEYHATIEAGTKPCRCGGRFRFDAPLRCANCRSVNIELGWPVLCYD